ncbi:MAG TPA: VOC family protein [Polyangia bacterium]|nr:VOC family protein [Polyangia bacterium]
MRSPRGVHHVALRVDDLARVEPFYRDVLALPVLRRWPKEDGGGSGAAGAAGAAGAIDDRSVWLDAGGGAFVALETAPGQATPDVRAARAATEGPPVLALRIGADERAAWEARLQAAGVAIYHRTAFTLYVRDPEGNRIGLSHYPDPQAGAAAGG